MISSAGMDYGFASGLDFGAMGIAYSSVCTNVLLLITNLLICWFKLNFEFADLKSDYDFHWLRKWSKVGLFSGFDSVIRNAVYLIVVLRAINTLDKQGNFYYF